MHAAKIDEGEGFIGTPAEIAALERRPARSPSVAGHDLPAARRVEKSATAERTVKRGGKTYKMKTAKLGKKKTAKPAAKIAREIARAQIAGHPIGTDTPATDACPDCHKRPTTYNMLEEGGHECGNCGARVSLAVTPYAAAKIKTCRKCGKPVSGKICANCGAPSR
jgi:hypothetical protein